MNPPMEFTVFQAAGFHTNNTATKIREDRLLGIEPEIRFLVLRIRSMAVKTLVRENWADVAVEIEFRLRPTDGRREKGQ